MADLVQKENGGPNITAGDRLREPTSPTPRLSRPPVSRRKTNKSPLTDYSNHLKYELFQAKILVFREPHRVRGVTTGFGVDPA